MFAIYGIVLVCLLAGGGLVWHSIGASAVAKHEQEVKIEQDKIDAVAEAEVNAEEKWLINTQAQHEVDVAQVREVEKKVYVKGQDYIKTVTVSKECVIPPAGMAILNGARGDLQNTTAATILGLDEPSTTVTIKPAPVAPPTPQPALSSRPPKPVPVTK